MTKELKVSLAMRAADAVKWADWEKWAEKSLEEFTAEVIRLNDEARGKEAIAWMGKDGALFHYALRPDFMPLFLSAPMIPEGMALVPPEKPLPDLRLASYHEAIGWNACRDSMLAAAQGERNAD